MSKTQYDSSKQITWIAILRGMAVLLVIITHSTLSSADNGIIGNFFIVFDKVFAFRMPLFFFIAGFLLFYTKIRKNSNFQSILKERIPRILYPYVFLISALFCVKLILNAYIKNPIDTSITGFFTYFIYPQTIWVTLWFLGVILIYFLLYPVLKISLKNTFGIVFTLLSAFCMSLFFPEGIEVLNLSAVFRYLVYFYVGILFAKFDVVSFLEKHTNLFLCAALPLFIVANLLVISETFNISDKLNMFKIIKSFSGIILSIYFALFCSRKIPTLFSSFRQYYYQIYLFGTFFQAAIWELYLRSSNQAVLILLSVVNVLAAIYLTVFMSKLIEKINWKPLLRVTGF